MFVQEQQECIDILSKSVMTKIKIKQLKCLKFLQEA